MQAIKLNKQAITIDQLKALLSVQQFCGRTWKSELLVAWSTGNYRAINVTDTSDLQRLRKTLGQDWLRGVTNAALTNACNEHIAQRECIRIENGRAIYA